MGTSSEAWPKVITLPDCDKVSSNTMEQIDLSLIIPTAHNDDLEFLKQILTLNPKHRLTSQESINHKYFIYHLPSPISHDNIPIINKFSDITKTTFKDLKNIVDYDTLTYDIFSTNGFE